MKPVDQRSQSDCLRCCVASIFELPYEAVPYFGPEYEPTEEITKEQAGVDQDNGLMRWLSEFGLSHIHVPNPKIVLMGKSGSAWSPWGFCIGEGKSPRGDWDHAVVYHARRGLIELIHDPHPSRAGLDGEPDSFICFFADNPSKLEKRK